MNRVPFPGAWYADATPSGAWAVLYPGSHIQTSRGRVELPGENVLFLVCGEYGGQLCLAGQGHTSGVGWLWNGSTWKAVSVTTPGLRWGTLGTSPCAFGPLGLYISTAAEPENVRIYDPLTFAQKPGIAQAIGARGIALVAPDGAVHSVDSWYGGHGLAEYIDLQGVYVGQGVDGGCLLGGRLLEPGDVQFIRAHRDGDRIAVAIWKPRESQAVAHWLTVAEIAQLPAVPPIVVPAPVPVPVPAPVPVPVPEPKPMPLKTVPMPARVPAIVQALYERNVNLAEGDDDQRRALILKIAQQLAFELGSQWGTKDAGGGRPQSKDAIAYYDGSTLYGADCFNGSTRKPAVPDVLTELPGQHFISVQAVDHLGATGKPTQPAPDPDGIGKYGDFTAAAKGLEEAIRGLASMAFQQGAEISALKAKIAALEARPVGGNVTGIADGSTVALKSHDNGEYVTVEPGGDVNAKGPRAFGAYQLFTIEVQQ